MLLCYIHPVFFYITLPPTCFGIQWAINRETNTREHFCEYAITLENTIYATLCTRMQQHQAQCLLTVEYSINTLCSLQQDTWYPIITGWYPWTKTGDTL